MPYGNMYQCVTNALVLFLHVRVTLDGVDTGAT